MALPQKKQASPFPTTIASDEEGRKSKGAPSCEWTPKQVAVLLDIYSKKFFSGRGCLRNKDWEEVVNDVNGCGEGFKSMKTLKQCRDKVDSLKRRYKIEKRKAVNGSAVTWPFFSKMDDLMGSVMKQGIGLDQLDLHFPRSSFQHFGYGDEEDGLREEKLKYSDSPEECAEDSIGYLENGKHRRDEVPVHIEDRELLEDGVRQHHMFKKSVRYARYDESTDYSSDQARSPYWPGASKSSRAKKHKGMYDDGIQNLADAVTGFSEVFARIELAKTEILSKIKLEMAKLQQRRTNKRTRKQKP